MANAPGTTPHAPPAADWRTPEVDDLCDAVVTLRNRDEASRGSVG